MTHITPHDFVHRWRQATVAERAGSQSHFNDLCELIGVDPPLKADPHGEWFAFEKGATKATGGQGFADVWRCVAQPGGRNRGGAGQAHAHQPLQQSPTWLRLAHERLDRAVLDAYGWPADITDDELLARGYHGRRTAGPSPRTQRRTRAGG
jgi:hypothetical protein